MRIQMNLSDEMVAKVDLYAKKMGVSRSALCALLIGQGIMNYEKSESVLESLGKELALRVK